MKNTHTLCIYVIDCHCTCVIKICSTYLECGATFQSKPLVNHPAPGMWRYAPSISAGHGPSAGQLPPRSHSV